MCIMIISLNYVGVFTYIHICAILLHIWMPHSVMCRDGRGDGRNEHLDTVVKEGGGEREREGGREGGS